MVKEKLFSVHWSRFAQGNLKDIHDYIKQDSPKNAVTVVAGIIELSKSLIQFPFKYEECAELPTKSKRQVEIIAYPSAPDFFPTQTPRGVIQRSSILIHSSA